jgi:hypothetical protein
MKQFMASIFMKLNSNGSDFALKEKRGNKRHPLAIQSQMQLDLNGAQKMKSANVN